MSWFISIGAGKIGDDIGRPDGQGSAFETLIGWLIGFFRGEEEIGFLMPMMARLHR